jgi:hypothetical protein
MHTVHKRILAAFVLTFLNSATYAKVFYADDFESSTIKYVGEANKHSGGGFISYLGGEIVGGVRPGDGTQDFTKYTNVILDSSSDAQGAVPNSKNALKTQYKAGYAPGTIPGFGYAGDFNLNTTMIAFPETDTVYVRWYQKWGANWTWPADQQKLLKLKGYNQSQNFKVSFGKNYINLTKKSPPPNGSMNETYVFADLATSGEGSVSTDWRQTDSESSTGNFPLSVNKWYCIEVMVKSNTLGKKDGQFSYWIDGSLKFDLRDTFNRDVAGGISHIELQHVIQDVWNKVRTKDTPTWMDNIAVADQRIGCEGGSPPSTPQTPRLIK